MIIKCGWLDGKLCVLVKTCIDNKVKISVYKHNVKCVMVDYHHKINADKNIAMRRLFGDKEMRIK